MADNIKTDVGEIGCEDSTTFGYGFCVDDDGSWDSIKEEISWPSEKLSGFQRV
jgi:hypothetical protein